jgi:hypothetical protein
MKVWIDIYQGWQWDFPRLWDWEKDPDLWQWLESQGVPRDHLARMRSQPGGLIRSWVDKGRELPYN